MSDFWKHVDDELEYLGKNRAFLAKKCEFSLANIGKGIKLGSVPAADTAVKIAKVLGVSVEYLVTGAKDSEDDEQNQLRLFRKYKDLIQKCEKLPKEQVLFLEQAADRLQK